MFKIVKIFGILILISLFSLSAFGKKNESVLSLLKNKTWILQGVNGVKISVKFKSNREINFIDGEQLRPFEFYLSNSKDSVFTYNKINKPKNGKFIISRIIRKKSDSRPKPINYAEIIEISKDKLVLKGKGSQITYLAEN